MPTPVEPPPEPVIPPSVSPWLTYDEASQELGLTVGEIGWLVTTGVLHTFSDRSSGFVRILLWRDTVEAERARRRPGLIAGVAA